LNSKHKDSGSGHSEYEDPITFEQTETHQRVENKSSEPEAIEINPPEPEQPQITYFPAFYLPPHRSRSPHPFTSAPTPPNPSTTPVAPMATTTPKELTGIGKPEPFKGDPSDLDRFFNNDYGTAIQFT
jgi:hypothetical protein